MNKTLTHRFCIQLYTYVNLIDLVSLLVNHSGHIIPQTFIPQMYDSSNGDIGNRWGREIFLVYPSPGRKFLGKPPPGKLKNTHKFRLT